MVLYTLVLTHNAQTCLYLLIIPTAEAACAQCAKTPIDPDRRSPCPPHLLPLPSILHEITENKKAQLDITLMKEGDPKVLRSEK